MEPKIIEKDGVSYLEYKGKLYEGKKIYPQDVCCGCAFKGKPDCVDMKCAVGDRSVVWIEIPEQPIDPPKLMRKVNLILAEYRRAVKENPEWPDDIDNAIEVIGEAVRCMIACNSKHKYYTLEVDLIQTAAMCLRCLVNLR